MRQLTHREWVLLVGALGGLALACAQQQMPPGGPRRHDPPDLVSILPESNSVNVRVSRVVFTFDEVVAEGPVGGGGGGASETGGLAAYFLISPRTGATRVGWHRDHLSVSPRGGFRPNTVYTVTMLPGISDLHGNVRRHGASVTFSTGPTIPTTAIRGRIFDWLKGEPARQAAIDALARPTDPKDSLDYVTVADSGGAFTLRHLPPGHYTVRGFIDLNNNHRLDAGEPWDSASVTLNSPADSARLELLAFSHDTIGPRVKDVTIRDSVTVHLTFDRGIDPGQQITASLFTLTSAKDSVRIAILRAVAGPTYDSARAARERARADSIVLADSIRRADSGIVRRDTAAANRRRALRQARQDSIALAKIPRPSRPIPVQDAVLELGAPLKPGTTYRLQIVGLRGLLGSTRPSTRTIVVPKAPPKKGEGDSTRTKPLPNRAGKKRG